MSTEIVRAGFLRKLAAEVGVTLPTDEFIRPTLVAESFSLPMLMGVPDRDYHTDLSAVARGDVLAALDSPAHLVARRQQPYEEGFEENDALRIGRMVHMVLLEPDRFKKSFTIEPVFVGKTKDGRDSTRSAEAGLLKKSWLASLAPGTMIVKPEDLVMLFGMARSISRNPTAMGIFEGAIFESTVYYRDPVTGLKCRVRPDIINRDLGVLADLKTTISADYGDFQRTAWNARYDIQLAMYSEGVYRATGEMPSAQPLIALEKKNPWSCVVFPVDSVMRERGHRDYRRGLDLIADCLAKDDWSGYPESRDLTLPVWALDK